MPKDPVVITYGDVTLHNSDCEMLEGPYWINDNLISYYQQHLTLDIFKDNNSVLFMAPSAMFMVMFMDNLQTELATLKLKERDLIFMPVTDHEDINTTGGSHWTLLVYSKADGAFYYYDSMNGRTRNAQQIADKMAAVLDVKLLNVNAAKIKQQPAPKQINGHDCGFYVLAISEQIAKNGISGSLDTLTPQTVGQYRQKLKQIIQDHVKNNVNS